MAQCWIDNKPLPEPMLTYHLSDSYEEDTAEQLKTKFNTSSHKNHFENEMC